MVRLDGKAEINLLISSDGNRISLGKNHALISVDVPNVPKDEEIMLSSKSVSLTSKCIFDKRTIDYICGLLSPTEYKMPKKKHRKSARIKKKRLKKTQGIVLRMER